MLDLRSRRPKLPTNQVRSLVLLRPWNGDSLKDDKNYILGEMFPVLISYSYHILCLATYSIAILRLFPLPLLVLNIIIVIMYEA